jgi:DNA-binding transcriptional ArsR family regulator
MNDDTLESLEMLFLALSDQTRLRLLSLMSGGEVSVGYLADSLGVSQPKISRHLAYLRSAALVSTRRDGKWIYYAIEPPAGAAARHVLFETLGTLGSAPETGAAASHRQRGYDDMQLPFESDYAPQEIEVWLL